MFKRIAIIFFVLSLAVPGVLAQKKVNEPEIKTWKIPTYMVENLQNMVNEFNRQFEIKVASYKLELRKRFEEFGDLPTDAIIDIKNGIFVDRKDYEKALEKIQKEQAVKEAEVKKKEPSEDKK